MSKKKLDNQGKDLIQSLKNIEKEKKAAARKPFTDMVTNVWLFVKFMVKFTFAAAIIFCGAYAVYKGYQSTYMLAHYALYVAGAAAITQGGSLLWQAVMKLNK